MTPSTDLGDAGRHPVPPTALGLVREALAESFTAAANALGDAMAVEVDLTTGRIDLPPSDPDASDAHAVESSATRTATGELGTVVLHETRTAFVSGKEIRTTIALTDSSHLGERFWLGATSYDGGAVSSIELVGELADFAGSALADVLDRLDPGSP